MLYNPSVGQWTWIFQWLSPFWSLLPQSLRHVKALGPALKSSEDTKHPAFWISTSWVSIGTSMVDSPGPHPQHWAAAGALSGAGSEAGCSKWHWTAHPLTQKRAVRRSVWVNVTREHDSVWFRGGGRDRKQKATLFYLSDLRNYWVHTEFCCREGAHSVAHCA